MDAKQPVLLDSRHPVVRLYLEHLHRTYCHQGDLQRERSAFQERPFTNTGIDYFGKFHFAVTGSTKQRWGLHFTCLTTRAVQFVVFPSMDTSSCAMGIDSFAARGSVPSVLWSDNGTNFVASENELLLNITNCNLQALTEKLVKRRIHWKFNPPSAPIMVGFRNELSEVSSTSFTQYWVTATSLMRFCQLHFV